MKYRKLRNLMADVMSDFMSEIQISSLYGDINMSVIIIVIIIVIERGLQCRDGREQ